MDEPDFFVVTDVHGCFKTFMALLEKMGVKDTDTLLNLGDAVDRGPRIKEVLDFLMQRPNIINVIGNHDYHFLDLVLKGPGPNNQFMMVQGLKETMDQLGSDAPKYAEFIRTWEKYVVMPEPATYVFCHSTYPWQANELGIFNEMHMWERWFNDSQDIYRHYKGPIIVHGHTPCMDPKKVHEFIDGKLVGINLDGGCCYMTPVSCLRGMRLSDGKIFEVANLD